MDNLTMLPMDWKPLREPAKAMAIEHHNAFSLRTWGDPDGWDMLEEDAADTLVRVQMDFLADLTRPTSRDFWARWLAERVGLTVGATAPVWVPIKGMDPSTIWSLSVRSGIDVDASPSAKVDQRGFVEPGAFPSSPIATVVPGISTLTDPVAALRAALLAVVPA